MMIDHQNSMVKMAELDQADVPTTCHVLVQKMHP